MNKVNLWFPMIPDKQESLWRTSIFGRVGVEWLVTYVMRDRFGSGGSVVLCLTGFGLLGLGLSHHQ